MKPSETPSFLQRLLPLLVVSAPQTRMERFGSLVLTTLVIFAIPFILNIIIDTWGTAWTVGRIVAFIFAVVFMLCILLMLLFHGAYAISSKMRSYLKHIPTEQAEVIFGHQAGKMRGSYFALSLFIILISIGFLLYSCATLVA